MPWVGKYMDRKRIRARTTASYAEVAPIANGPALDEQRMRAEGTAELHDEYGVVFGVAHWRPGPYAERWYARATSNARVMTVGRTVAAVTRQLARKLETR